jgi:lipid A ethanolaminephosphotransferase
MLSISRHHLLRHGNRGFCTVHVLQYAARAYDEELAHHQEGVLDILQRAGIQVLWNDNDGGCKGACDRVPHQNVTDLKLSGQCIDGECYDEVLFHNLESYIDNLQAGRDYRSAHHRQPRPDLLQSLSGAVQKVHPTCDTNEIQSCTQQQLTNTYDNTILYVDYVVDKAIKLLQSKQDKFTTSLVYLSDHGESLGEDGVYLHGLPWSIAPDTQKHVPMLLWLSRITNSAMACPASVCSKKRKRKRIRRIIFSPPCSVCSGSAPASTRQQMIF